MSDDEKLSFEEALDELEDIVSQLESGELTLEETLQLFERGQALVGRCEDALNQAELRLEALQPSASGGYERVATDEDTIEG
jgi:exodeoxyribonuclease VII small subunit